VRLSHFHKRIAKKTQDASEAPVLIVAFGDSVTQGFSRANTIEPKTVYHQQLKEKLEQSYPLCTFSVINAGVAGAGAKDSLGRLERDVIRHQPDLVLIAFGLNDAVVLGQKRSQQFKASLEEISKGLREKTQADLILLTPNFMASADNPNIHPSESHYLADLLPVQTEGVLATYTEIIRDVAASQTIVLADVYRVWEQWAEQGKDTHKLLANGLNHPNAEAHAMAAKVIFEAIEGAQ
jgi:lysophospholipase L1-like esterase